MTSTLIKTTATALGSVMKEIEAGREDDDEGGDEETKGDDVGKGKGAGAAVQQDDVNHDNKDETSTAPVSNGPTVELNGGVDDPVVSVGALLKFMTELVSSSLMSPVTEITGDGAGSLTKPPRSFITVRNMLVEEFGQKSYDAHAAKLTDTFELMYTKEADGVIDRAAGFDSWFQKTRLVKNIAREGAEFLGAVASCFATWHDDLLHVYESAEFEALRTVESSTVAKRYSYKYASSSSSHRLASVGSSGGAFSALSLSSSKTSSQGSGASHHKRQATLTGKQQKGRFWQNSTLQRAARQIFVDHMCHRAHAASAIGKAITHTSLSHLATQRSYLKATFHRLQAEERDSLRQLGLTAQRMAKSLRELREAEDASFAVVEALADAQRAQRATGSEKTVECGLDYAREVLEVVWARKKVLSSAPGDAGGVTELATVKAVNSKKLAASHLAAKQAAMMRAAAASAKNNDSRTGNGDGGAGGGNAADTEDGSDAGVWRTPPRDDAPNQGNSISPEKNRRHGNSMLGLTASVLRTIRSSHSTADGGSSVKSEGKPRGGYKRRSIANLFQSRSVEDSPPTMRSTISTTSSTSGGPLGVTPSRHITSGMVLVHIGNRVAPSSYEEVMALLDTSPGFTRLIFAPSSHIANLNATERLAAKLADASRRVKASREVMDAARAAHRADEDRHQSAMQSIFRQFRRVEAGRCAGMRATLSQLLDTCLLQRYCDSRQRLGMQTSKVVLQIDATMDFKMYAEFNARVSAYHNQGNARVSSYIAPTLKTPKPIAGAGRSPTTSPALGSRASSAAHLQPTDLTLGRSALPSSPPPLLTVRSVTSAKHHRRKLSVAAPPVPARPSAAVLKKVSLARIEAVTPTLSSETLGGSPWSSVNPSGAMARSASKSLPSQHSRTSSDAYSDLRSSVSPRSLQTQMTFVDHLHATSFARVLHYLAAGRDWYRALQHHLEYRASTEGKLGDAIEEMAGNCLQASEIAEAGTSSGTSGGSGSSSSASSSASSSTRTHMQLWHAMQLSFAGWRASLEDSSARLATQAVRVRHLKRELKGTVGMVQERSEELDKQLRRAEQAPLRAIARCNEFEVRLAALEQRYLQKQRKSGIDRRSNKMKPSARAVRRQSLRLHEEASAASVAMSSASSSAVGVSRSREAAESDPSGASARSITPGGWRAGGLESAVLSCRDKTEAARQRVTYARTEARVMRGKHERCLQQLLQLTETKFLHFYREMKACLRAFLQHQRDHFVASLESSNDLLTALVADFDHAARTAAFEQEFGLRRCFLPVVSRDGERVQGETKSTGGGGGAQGGTKPARGASLDTVADISELFLHTAAPRALDEAREATAVYSQLGAFCHGVHRAMVVACDAIDSDSFLEDALMGRSHKLLFGGSGGGGHEATVAIPSSYSSSATLASTVATPRSEWSMSTPHSSRPAGGSNGAGPSSSSAGFRQGSMMARTLEVLRQHEDAVGAQLRRLMLSPNLAAGVSFTHLAKITEDTTARLSGVRKRVCAEYDRLRQISARAEAAATKANAAYLRSAEKAHTKRERKRRKGGAAKVGEPVAGEAEDEEGRIDGRNDKEALPSSEASSVRRSSATSVSAVSATGASATGSSVSISSRSVHSATAAAVAAAGRRHKRRDSVAETTLCVLSAVKRSHSGMRSRLSQKTRWVRRDICVDPHYVGWFTEAVLQDDDDDDNDDDDDSVAGRTVAAATGVARDDDGGDGKTGKPRKAGKTGDLTPTGGVQTALIEDIGIEEAPHFKGCPEPTVVFVRRVGSESKRKAGKLWHFGFQHRADAERLVRTVRTLTQMREASQMRAMMSGGGVARAEREMRLEVRSREKRDASASHVLFVDHVLTTFTRGEYARTCAFVAKGLRDMQEQRQVFVHSILQTMVGERSRLTRLLEDNERSASAFADTVDPPSLLQQFILDARREQAGVPSAGQHSRVSSMASMQSVSR